METTSPSYSESDPQQDSACVILQVANTQVAARRVGLAPLLLMVVLCQCALLIWLVRQNPLALYRIDSFLHPQPATAPRPKPDKRLMAQDPALEAYLPSQGVGGSVRTSVSGDARGYLLVPVGDCAGCLNSNLRLWQSEAAKRGVKLVLLTSGDQDAINRFRANLGPQIPIVPDQQGTLTRSLNVIWPGRAYLYSRKWRLIWIQRDDAARTDPFSDKRFLSALEMQK